MLVNKHNKCKKASNKNLSFLASNDKQTSSERALNIIATNNTHNILRLVNQSYEQFVKELDGITFDIPE